MNESQIASPAEMIQQLLIDMLLAADIDVPTDWPVYIGLAPAKPDNLIVCYDTAGEDQGRIMSTGERIVKPGVQIRVRGRAYDEAYRKAKWISLSLASLRNVQVIVGEDKAYTITSISQPGDILPMGLVTEGDRNNFNFTINILLSLAASEIEDLVFTSDGYLLFVQS